MTLLVWDVKNNVIRKASRKELFEAIYMLVSTIPVGRVVSYKDIARVLNVNPRTIGYAMKNNRKPLITPCHRVVGSRGELKGYSRGGVIIKKKLLELEGVVIENYRVDYKYFIDLSKLLDP